MAILATPVECLGKCLRYVTEVLPSPFLFTNRHKFDRFFFVIVLK